MPEVKPHQHGTNTGYNYGCRCDACKEAVAEYARRRRESNDPRYKAAQLKYREANRESLALHERDRRAVSPESTREATRKWRRANPEKARLASRRWKEANPESGRQWREANGDRFAENNRRAASVRRARMCGAFVESVTHAEIFERDNWTCHICGKQIDRNMKGRNPLAPSIDHIIPLAKGGLHERSNLAAAHFGCNSSKWMN